MKTITSASGMQEAAESFRRAGKTVALVPTMGFLHDGHASLIRIARKRSDIVITSVFVNPTQFAPNEDFSKYPRDIGRDSALAKEAGSDIFFTPEAGAIYPAGYHTYVTVDDLSARLEGSVRPTHFRGVATVVAKLFHLTKPHIAVFGQKDAQQAVIIKKMASDLNFDVEIVIGPIVREPDGLAMSSRNVYLSESERKQSTALYRSLQHAEERVRGGERTAADIVAGMRKIISQQPQASIDYIAVSDPGTLEEAPLLAAGRTYLISLAVRFGSTRLIDNTVVSIP